MHKIGSCIDLCITWEWMLISNNWTRTQTLVHPCLLFTLQSQDTCIVVDVSVTALPNNCSYNKQELYLGCFLVTHVTIYKKPIGGYLFEFHQDLCLIVLYLQVRHLFQSDYSCSGKNTLLSFKVGTLFIPIPIPFQLAGIWPLNL